MTTDTTVKLTDSQRGALLNFGKRGPDGINPRFLRALENKGLIEHDGTGKMALSDEGKAIFNASQKKEKTPPKVTPSPVATKPATTSTDPELTLEGPEPVRLGTAKPGHMVRVGQSQDGVYDAFLVYFPRRS